MAGTPVRLTQRRRDGLLTQGHRPSRPGDARTQAAQARLIQYL